jgi:HPt (histidine-containing phosphotransfer) domain-containing protein
MDSGHDRLKNLIARHCETLRTNADLLAGFVAKMGDPDNGSGQAARDARHIAHQIAGAGGSIGFMEVSVLASDLERAIEPIVAVNGVPSAAQSEKIEALLAGLRKAAAELRPEMSTLYGVNIPAAAAEARRRAS